MTIAAITTRRRPIHSFLIGLNPIVEQAMIHTIHITRTLLSVKSPPNGQPVQ